MFWYILRHSQFIHFFLYILYQANFQNRKSKCIFDNNYIIILYIKIECLKQRFWLLLWYLLTCFSSYNLSKCPIMYLCFVQTWIVGLELMFMTLLVWVFIDCKERQYIYILIRVYLNFIIGDLRHHCFSISR